jgi:hypothetical protein
MAGSKTIGYVLIAVGFIVFILSFPQVAKIIKLSMITGMVANIVMVVGVVIVGVGAFIASKGSSGEVAEVPIYGGKGGKEVVGFRRIKK